MTFEDWKKLHPTDCVCNYCLGYVGFDDGSAFLDIQDDHPLSLKNRMRVSGLNKCALDTCVNLTGGTFCLAHRPMSKDDWNWLFGPGQAV